MSRARLNLSVGEVALCRALQFPCSQRPLDLVVLPLVVPGAGLLSCWPWGVPEVAGPWRPCCRCFRCFACSRSFVPSFS